jgi:hypothetical protein
MDTQRGHLHLGIGRPKFSFPGWLSVYFGLKLFISRPDSLDIGPKLHLSQKGHVKSPDWSGCSSG